jgi:HopA1 effector protein family
VAVDPGTGESYGTHRCRLAAEGIVDAWHAGSQDVLARLEAVAARFAAAGLDLGRPYLGPGGADLFDVLEPTRLP